MHLQNTLWAGHRLQAKLRVKVENHAKVGLLKFESLIELHIGKDLEKDSRFVLHSLSESEIQPFSSHRVSNVYVLWYSPIRNMVATIFHPKSHSKK